MDVKLVGCTAVHKVARLPRVVKIRRGLIQHNLNNGGLDGLSRVTNMLRKRKLLSTRREA